MVKLSVSERAQYATASRLICAFVNERMVSAIFEEHTSERPFAKQIPETAIGMARLASLDSSSSRDSRNLLVPLRLQPQVTKGTNNICLIDPDDLLRAPFVLESVTGDGAVQQTYGQVLDPLAIMDLVAAWDPSIEAVKVDMMKAELQNSVENQEYIYKHRQPIPTLDSSSSDWEQFLIEGHPQHPMHRTRQAQPPLVVAPSTGFELNYLVFFVLPLEQVHHHGTYMGEIHPQIMKALGVSPSALPADHVIVPAHREQVPMILHHFPHLADEKHRLPYLVPMRVQSSLRTVEPLMKCFLPGCQIKLSLSVLTTGALRTISKYSVHNATIISRLANMVNHDENGLLKVYSEEASIGVKHNDPAVSKVMGCIIRRAPYQPTESAGGLIAEKYIVSQALVERDCDSGVPSVITAFQLHTPELRRRFFIRYVDLLLGALVPSLIKYKFAFEGHGQNMLLRIQPVDSTVANGDQFDVFNGHRLVGFAVRDFGGVRIHRGSFERATGVSLDNIMHESNIVLDDEDEVYHKAHHTILDNHIHRLLRSLDLYADNSGWALVREAIARHVDPSSRLWAAWMSDKTELKCYVQMKLKDLYRDDIWQAIDNVVCIGR